MGIRYTGEGSHIQSRGRGSHGACRMRIIYCNSLHLYVLSFPLSLTQWPSSHFRVPCPLSDQPALDAAEHPSLFSYHLHVADTLFNVITSKVVYYDAEHQQVFTTIHSFAIPFSLPLPPRFSVLTNKLANFPEIDLQTYPEFSDYFQGSRHLARETQYGNLFCTRRNK